MVSIISNDLDGIDFTTDFETFSIAPGILVYGPGGGVLGSAIFGQADFSVLENNGHLVGSEIGVSFIDGAEDATIINAALGNISGGLLGISFGGAELLLGNYGDITSEAIAINLVSTASDVEILNFGTIYGAEWGIHDQSLDGCSINNTGMIQANQVAVRVVTAPGQTVNIDNGPGAVIDGGVLGIIVFSGRLVLTNNGTINGGVWLFDASDNDVIVNKGIIRDGVDLGDGNDVYTGAAIDVLGSFGNDKLTGASTNDEFDGGDGNDLLTGGRGRDFLTGGTDRDTFDFNSTRESRVGAARDIITDFNRQVDDRIDLTTIDAKTGVAGNNAFKFIGTKAFTDTKGELRCKSGVIQGDVNGDGKADFEIKVNLATMVAGDFFL